MDRERRVPACRACAGRLEEVLALAQTPEVVQTLLEPGRIGDDHPVSLRVCRCLGCGLVQLDGDPDLGRADPGDSLSSVNSSAHARAYQDELARRWVRQGGLAGRRVLEVGGGDGFFASLLLEQGCDVTLIDPAPRACQAARQRGIPRVVEGDLDPGTFPGESFDAVVARHVLEHVPRPAEFLHLLRGRLRPRGLLFVEVPNLDGTVANRRFQDFDAGHLAYFDPRSLTTVLAASGFEVLGLETIEGGDSLAGVARISALGIDAMASDLRRYVERFRELAEESKAKGRRLAVWGAGGRCVALLALVCAQELGVAYVIDSDPKKWALVTPVTHLRVVSPESLRSDPVDDLLVAATAFQDEILGELDRSGFALEGRRLGVVQPEPRWIAGGGAGGTSHAA